MQGTEMETRQGLSRMGLGESVRRKNLQDLWGLAGIYKMVLLETWL